MAIMRFGLLVGFGLSLSGFLFAGDLMKQTEFTKDDALSMILGKGWSFSYAPTKPVGRLDLLIFEEKTDEAGKTTTTVRRGTMLGMGAPREGPFDIKLLLVGEVLHLSIDSGGSTIKLSDSFAFSAVQYRGDKGCKEDAQGRWSLIEIGNSEDYKGNPPFNMQLKFKIFENLDQPSLDKLLRGDSPPETTDAHK